MKTLKSTVGYAGAIAAFFIVLATFFGSDYFSRKLASVSGVVISPRMTGGEIVKTIDHGAYKTSIHRPVFDALIGESKAGFVQIRWEPFGGLPPLIEEKIDYSGQQKEDFLITLDTKTGKASLMPYSHSVVSIEEVYKLKDGWAVRVHLKKPS